MIYNVSDTTLYLLGENINNVAVIGHTQGANNSTFTHFLNPRTPQSLDAAPGNLVSEASVCELLDICVLFYYSAGHKYIIKVAAVRDEIATLNEVLKETKYYREDIERRLIAIEQHTNVCMNENHQHVMSELRAKFSQRQNVFAVSALVKIVFHLVIKLLTTIFREIVNFNDKFGVPFIFLLFISTGALHIAGTETSLASSRSTE